MTSGTVSLQQLNDWLARFSLLIADPPIGHPAQDARLTHGMAAVVAKVSIAPQTETVEGYFRAVGMTLVESAGGGEGTLYGTFFLRLGMGGGPVATLDAGALGRALRAGLEGVVARSGASPEVETMSSAIDAYNESVAGGAAASVAASAASAAVDRGDTQAPSVALLFHALAAALTHRELP